MDHQVWIGYAFREGHVFDYSVKVCCGKRYTDPKAKFCMVCGKGLTEIVELSPTPAFKGLLNSMRVEALRPMEGYYPASSVKLTNSIAAEWVPTFDGFFLVVGISLGGSFSPAGHRGSPLLLTSIGENGDLSWEYKQVNEFFEVAFGETGGLFKGLKASLVIWASGLLAGPDINNWDASKFGIENADKWPATPRKGS